MNKKVTLIISVMLVLMLAIAGCSSETPQDNNGGDVTNGGDVANEQVDPLKVIMLIPGNLGDKSFYDLANEGIKKIEADFGATTKVVEMGTDPTNWEPNFYDAADGDWDIIISNNETTELMNRIATEYPDKKFINFDTSDDTVEDNVYSMFYSSNEGSYLAGALAALVTDSDMENANDEQVIGFIGGMDIPGINDFLVGYIEGAQSINPDIKVIVSYAGSFVDPAKGKELAMVQYNAGADIIYSAAGGTGLGAIDAAKEKKAYAIGVDSDQALLFKDTDPEKAQTIVTSSIKKIDQAIYNAVESYNEGTLEFGTYNKMGVADEVVGLAKNDYYNQLPEDIKTRMEEVEGTIVAGDVEVMTAFGLTSQEVEDIRAGVRP